VTDISVPCAPLDVANATVQLASGSLTYNAGTVFLSVEGAAEPLDAGNGCSNAGGPASLFVTCSDDAGGVPGAETDAGSGEGGLGSGFVGVYACRDSEDSVRPPPGGLQAVSGGTGTLTITESEGDVLTAAHADDLFVEGALQFVAKTGSAAVPATTNETMQVTCVGSAGPPPDGGYAMASVSVTASTLTIDGNWILLSFVGNMPPGSSCAGAVTSGTVLCAK
jgi:hypothetical protein